MRGTVSINGNIDKSKISNPCDKELFISGNVTDSIIIHAQGIFLFFFFLGRGEGATLN